MSKLKQVCRKPANAALAVCQVLGGNPATGEASPAQKAQPLPSPAWGKWLYRAALAAVAGVAIGSAAASQPNTEAMRDEGYTNIGTKAVPLYRSIDVELGVACYRASLGRFDEAGAVSCVHVPAGV